MLAMASTQYVSITYTWCGDQIYFSHQAIIDFGDFCELSGFGSGSSAIDFKEFLAEHGLN
jgi:hypothetical protein